MQVSAIRADDGLIKACAEAVEELKAARVGLEKQGRQIEKQKELLAVERDISAKLKNINSLSEREKDELRKVLAAKDRVISSLESEVVILKKQRFTLWKAVKIGLAAGGAGYLLGRIF